MTVHDRRNKVDFYLRGRGTRGGSYASGLTVVAISGILTARFPFTTWTGSRPPKRAYHKCKQVKDMQGTTLTRNVSYGCGRLLPEFETYSY